MRAKAWLLVGLVLAIPSARAHADERAREPAVARPALGELLTAEDKANYEEGRALFASEQFGAAAKKFELVYDRSADARLLWNMAACEKRMRHYAKSLLLVQRYLTSGDARLHDEDRLEAEQLIAALRPFTASLSVRADEPGADVVVDDVFVGTTPLSPVLVDIGLRQVRVRKAGFVDVTNDTFIDGGSPVAVVVNLTKARLGGRLNVRAPAAASILVDGRGVGSASWSGTVSSGSHVVRVTAPNKIPFEKEIFVRGNEARDVTVSLDADRGSRAPTWVWVVGGVVLAGAAAAGGYYVVKHDQAR